MGKKKKQKKKPIEWRDLTINVCRNSFNCAPTTATTA